jgi:hypothetical protein
MKLKFVFLQVGEDALTTLMVRSIKKQMPNAEVFQCSDAATARIPGVDHISVCAADRTNLMTFRLAAFSQLNLNAPAAYIDTDILFTKPCSVDALLQDCDVAVCRRSFARDSLINTNFRGIDLSEYRGKTLADVYPYLASFNVTRSYEFWEECLNELHRLDKKFHWWYGDQEAIRNVLLRGGFCFRELEESDVSCLPECINLNSLPVAIHFKGQSRKAKMPDAARRIGIG